MKLLNNLHNIILEESTPWYEKVFQSEDHESLWPLIKLFGGNIHDMYINLDKMGMGERVLKPYVNTMATGTSVSTYH